MYKAYIMQIQNMELSCNEPSFHNNLRSNSDNLHIRVAFVDRRNKGFIVIIELKEL